MAALGKLIQEPIWGPREIWSYESGGPAQSAHAGLQVGILSPGRGRVKDQECHQQGKR